MPKRLTVIAGLILSLAGASTARAQFDAGIPLGSPAPRVSANDLEGNPFDLGRLIGTKPVLLEFWATWCPICKGLLPQLEVIRKNFGDRIELIGVNVTVNDSKARVRRYLTEHRPAFRVLWDDKGALVRAFDAPATSFVVIVDRSGKVAYTGSGEDQDLVSAARKALSPL